MCIRAGSDTGPVREWYQPILDQPEVGFRRTLVKEFDRVLRFRVRA